MRNIHLEVHCPTCLNGFYYDLDLEMMVRGWDTVMIKCPNCNTSLLVSYEVRPSVKMVRPVRDPVPVVLGEERHG